LPSPGARAAALHRATLWRHRAPTAGP